MFGGVDIQVGKLGKEVSTRCKTLNVSFLYKRGGIVYSTSYIKEMKMENINELQSMKASGTSNIVRVSVAPSAYFKLDAIQKVQKDILGRLG